LTHGITNAQAGELPGVIVAKELMKSLALRPGDTLSLVSPIGKEGRALCAKTHGLSLGANSRAA